MKPIRKHIINTASSQNLVLIHSRQEKVATLKRGICLSSRSQPTNFKCPNSWSSNTLANWFKEPTHWKRPRCWKRMKTGGEGATEDKTVGWHHRLKGHEFEQMPGDRRGQRSLACCSPWGCKELDTSEVLSNRSFQGVSTLPRVYLSVYSQTSGLYPLLGYSEYSCCENHYTHHFFGQNFSFHWSN